MAARIWTAYTVELFKALRHRFTYIGPLLVLLVIVLMTLTHPLERDGQGDYDFIAGATAVALDSLGLLLVLAFSAALIASELGAGSIRLALVRPLHRYEFVVAKLLLGMSYAVLLALVAGVASWAMAYALGDVRGVSYGGELVYTAEEMRETYLLGLLLTLAPLWAAVAFAVMLSTLTRSAAAAVTGTIGIWLVADLTKHPLGIHHYVFTTYVESPLQVFAQKCDAYTLPWFPMAWYCLGTSAVVFVVCAAVSIYVLDRRNLT